MKETSVNLKWLFSDGLYYHWSQYHKRPCLMPSKMPDGGFAVVAFNNEALAKRHSKLMGQEKEEYPVRHVPLEQLYETLQGWYMNGWEYLEYPMVKANVKDGNHQQGTTVAFVSIKLILDAMDELMEAGE